MKFEPDQNTAITTRLSAHARKDTLSGTRALSYASNARGRKIAAPITARYERGGTQGTQGTVFDHSVFILERRMGVEKIFEDIQNAALRPFSPS
jgi:hypothetical protein